eukprot:CAMPEP_0115072810 /NCGR_PEP_ID=MMETSP0227-20121206/14438_1 /TAXON_ID=89957 /ORGANISM="Polarella glacialis, Strain CCMP 1383" /LENGTH=306 /DNA_ID=CAMNT_0002459601 /DNA_START=123 /DNA_END=1043 /DNA_ORIENTATION=-
MPSNASALVGLLLFILSSAVPAASSVCASMRPGSASWAARHQPGLPDLKLAGAEDEDLLLAESDPEQLDDKSFEGSSRMELPKDQSIQPIQPSQPSCQSAEVLGSSSSSSSSRALSILILLASLALLLGLSCFVAHKNSKPLGQESVEASPKLTGSRLLLQKREDTDTFGCTALHAAAQQGFPSEVAALLRGGSDPNAREAWDETPLHLAARAGCLEAVKLLVLNRAQLNLANADEKTPLTLAAEAGHQDICEFLLDHGAKTSGKSDELPRLLSWLLLQRILFEQPKAKHEATESCSQDEGRAVSR